MSHATTQIGYTQRTSQRTRTRSYLSGIQTHTHTTLLTLTAHVLRIRSIRASVRVYLCVTKHLRLSFHTLVSQSDMNEEKPSIQRR